MWQDPGASSRAGLSASSIPSCNQRSPEFINERCENSAAHARDGMPERDGAAVGIQPFAIKMQVAVAREHLRRKRFVQFDRVVVFHFRTGAFRQIAHGRHRTNPHHARIKCFPPGTNGDLRAQFAWQRESDCLRWTSPIAAK